MLPILLFIGLLTLPAIFFLSSYLLCRTLSHEQVQASLGALHRAIDRAISNEDQAGHLTDGRAKQLQEIVGFEPEARMNPIPALANLVFWDN